MSEGDLLAGVAELLKHRNRQDLAQLLQHAWLELEESNQYGSRLFSKLTTAHIHAPIEDYERLRSLSDYDQIELLGQRPRRSERLPRVEGTAGSSLGAEPQGERPIPTLFQQVRPG